jgi:hypothetical protein
MSPAPLARVAALAIAAIAIAGLGTHFAALLASAYSPLMASWILLRYFTIITNLLVAGLFLAIAVSSRVRIAPKLMGGTVLSIVLVGAVYALLLSGQQELSGGSFVADILLHRVTPVAVPLFWLWRAPKGCFTWRDPFIWALYPLGYFIYALARGHLDGHYAYPFMDAALLGGPRTALNAAAIGAGFCVAGGIFLWVDRRLGRAA